MSKLTPSSSGSFESDAPCSSSGLSSLPQRADKHVIPQSDIRSYVNQSSSATTKVDDIGASTSSASTSSAAFELQQLQEMFPSFEKGEISSLFQENNMDLEATINTVLGASGTKA